MLNGHTPNSFAPQRQRPESTELAVQKHPRRTRDRAGKQHALIQAALHLFATKGYETTTTREIAAAAGCAEGLIHRYFTGKAGLLSALIEYHTSNELREMSRRPPSALGLEEEFLELVGWEVEHMWKSRDFLRIFIPRAITDTSMAGVLHRAVLSLRTKAVIERLRRYRQCATLPLDQVEALAQSVGMLGLIFGFMRPMVLGQDRALAKKTAITLATILVRGVQYGHLA
jgi:AcrR family transcriptional regulator